LVLPLLAALTPADVDVRLVDENVESVDVNAATDWVAITCMTTSAPHAYAIADAFRQRGVPVVMGGIHPTVLPDEAAAHAEAVVIGEAEPVWREVLADLAAGRIRPRYKHDGYADLSGLPPPRRELLAAVGLFVVGCEREATCGRLRSQPQRRHQGEGSRRDAQVARQLRELTQRLACEALL
jgi:radical SAM superfamily enzyme YgiQ (UPF0313 family)